MSNILVIPDVHLKPEIFLKAETVVESSACDRVVMLGDLPDDWGMEENISLYEKTYELAADFCKRHNNTLFCYGNHDISYIWQALETGYSSAARETVLNGMDKIKAVLPEENIAFIHRIDNVLFSHAGLAVSFVLEYFGYGGSADIDMILDRVNRMGYHELWKDNSPIWARPQDGSMRLYPRDMLQVVGHTPVNHAVKEDNFLSLDVFSTYREGDPIGDGRFVIVDSITQEYRVIED